MKIIYEFDVRGEGNKLFCKWREENGQKILIGADGHRIPFDSLQRQVLNPSPQKGREQRQNKHRKVS